MVTGVSTRLTIIACLALAASWPQNGFAEQADAPQGRVPLGSSLSVTPALVVVVGHISNAIRTNTGGPAGEVYMVPQVEGWLGRGRVRLNFASAVELSKQQVVPPDQEQAAPITKGTLNQYHLARFEMRGARASLEGHGSYRNHYAPPTDSVAST